MVKYKSAHEEQQIRDIIHQRAFPNDISNTFMIAHRVALEHQRKLQHHRSALSTNRMCVLNTLDFNLSPCLIDH